jgi:hypothetical protein
LFADIDFNDAPSCLFFIPIILLAVYFTWQILHHRIGTFHSGLAGFFVGLVLCIFLLPVIKQLLIIILGGAERRARRRIDTFMKGHPDWHLRLYRTPGGYRLLAMHCTFSPDDPAVTKCFQTLGVDPIYTRMCRNQQCFRARLSPKPWRIGIIDHMKPRPGYWPVNPERLPERSRWIEAYETKAQGYASCRFVEALGSDVVDSTAQAIQVIHDEFCRATSGLPIA